MILRVELKYITNIALVLVTQLDILSLKITTVQNEAPFRGNYFLWLMEEEFLTPKLTIVGII